MDSSVVKLSQEEVRKISLNIFRKVEEICKTLDIQCWVMYGTLIGVARHKGYIPWDDDFDIAMKREDYEKFIDYCCNNKEKIAPYYVEHFRYNKEYPLYIARVCDPSYTLIFENLKYKSGIFIDIYPFDGMGDNLEFWKAKSNSEKNKLSVEILKTMVWVRSLNNPFVGRNIFFKIFRGMLGLYSKTRSRMYWLSKLDSISQKFDWEKSKYVGLSTWSTRVYGLRKEWFNETIYMDFENISVPVPIGYKSILEEIYGDYMKLPPKEEQIPTHWYTAYKNKLGDVKKC